MWSEDTAEAQFPLGSYYQPKSLSMMTKLMELLGSLRFWQVTLVAVLAVLDGQSVIPVMQVWLGAVAAIGTFDSIASRFAGTKV